MRHRPFCDDVFLGASETINKDGLYIITYKCIAVVLLCKAFVVKEVSTLSDVEDVEVKFIDLYSSYCPIVVMVSVLYVVIGGFDLSDLFV